MIRHRDKIIEQSLSTMDVEGRPTTTTPVCVCTVEEFPTLGPQRRPGRQFKVHGRRVAVFRVGGSYHCVDDLCYHAGGPLALGDLEDMGARPCVACPWHGYLVALDTGEGVKIEAGQMVSKGMRQRVHQVEVRDGSLWVTLNCGPDIYPSDQHYAGLGPPTADDDDEEDVVGIRISIDRA